MRVIHSCPSPCKALGPATAVLIGALALPLHGSPYIGPIAPIDSGFGADGPFEMVADTVPARFMHHRPVYVYRPVGADAPRPVVFFFPAFLSWDPASYNHLIRHLVSRGYCVVYPAYRLAQFPYQRRTYKRLFSGATAGMKSLGELADTSRIGFAGHSFGGSAIPPFAWSCLRERGWGANGTFMYIMAPFFMFRCRQERLEDFPDHVKMIVQVYEDDDCNDHRMAKDIFEAITIPPGNKDFIILRSDTCPATGYRLIADHGVPFSGKDSEGEIDGADFYGVFRLIDALAEHAFTGDTTAGNVALGNGSLVQRYMGTWPDGTPVRPPVITDEAPLLRPRKAFYFKWTHPWNLRRRWDQVILDDPWDE
ncbi:MAG: hypothetical protein GF331_10340 [Chitinivibrionales bacterium]|nr:hypothetical protein [Chitinivibrionales bacterium]